MIIVSVLGLVTTQRDICFGHPSRKQKSHVCVRSPVPTGKSMVPDLISISSVNKEFRQKNSKIFGGLRRQSFSRFGLRCCTQIAPDFSGATVR